MMYEVIMVRVLITDLSRQYILSAVAHIFSRTFVVLSFEQYNNGTNSREE